MSTDISNGTICLADSSLVAEIEWGRRVVLYTKSKINSKSIEQMLATDFASWSFHYIYVNYDIFWNELVRAFRRRNNDNNTIQCNQSILFIELSTKPLATEALGEHSPHTERETHTQPSSWMLGAWIVRLIIDWWSD